MWKETAELFLGFAETIIILAGLLAAAYQIRQTARAVDQASDRHKEENDWNRKIAAQTALERTGASPVLSKLQKRFRYIDKRMIIPFDEIESACAEDDELKTELFGMLNSYEKIARGVNFGIYDDSVIRAARRGSISKAYLAFLEMIEHRRTEYGARQAWKELESLVLSWEASDPTWLTGELGAHRQSSSE